MHRFLAQRSFGDITRSLWLDGGVRLTVYRGLGFGLLGRWSIGNNMSLHGTRRDPGGRHLGLIAGYRWGP